jgi:hypothetical protein
MSRRTEKATIGGFECEIQQLPPKDSIRILTTLIKIFGGPVAGGLKGIVKELKLDDVDGLDGLKTIFDQKINYTAIFAQLGDVVELLAERLDEDIVVDTIEKVFPYIFIEGKQCKWEMDEFQGNPVLILKVFAKSLEVNYKDFLAGLLAKRGEKSKKKQRALTE